MDFSEIFDIPRLQNILRKPILEWWEVKNFTAPDAAWDDVGCWSPWALTGPDGKPRGNGREGILKLGA